MPSQQAVLLKAITAPKDSTTLEPGPAFHATSPRAALRRCYAAWKRAYDANLATGQDTSIHRLLAARDAGPAYRNAMPLLAGHDGIRDYIACTAQGILIGAIPQEMSGPLLYAAQVALAALQRDPATNARKKQPGPSLTVPAQRNL